MSKHEIEVEGLPEGWEPVAFRAPKNDDTFIRYDGKVVSLSDTECVGLRLIVKKKQPRRIVLEETEEKIGDLCQQHFVRTDGSIADFRIISENKWREVKETEELKLCLSVEECERILRIAVLPKSAEEKIKLFLRNNNKTS